MLTNPARHSIVLLAGPTASGKSNLAISLAKALDAWVVNADSMQVYREWRTITARPSTTDEKEAPHRLYGHRSVAQPYSVGVWIDELSDVLDEANSASKRLIVTGGSGLNFTAATKGLSPIPNISPEIRAQTEALHADLGPEAFRVALLERDPLSKSLDVENPRRAQRAWEVFEATGRSIVEWSRQPSEPVIPQSAILTKIVLSPPRDLLAMRIKDRLAEMIDLGALEEVATVEALRLNRSLPATRAIGAQTFATHLLGEMSLTDALETVAAQTRQYAKRQRTWFRNQLHDWPVFETADAAKDYVFRLEETELDAASADK